MKPLKALGFAAIVLCFVRGAQAQSAGVESVSISAKGSVFVIEVKRPELLPLVLDRFCLASNIQCEGTQNASGTVIPLTLTGTWSQVVAKLLEGSSTNYSAIPPSSTSPGRLIIRPRAPGSGIAHSAHQGSMQRVLPQPEITENPAPIAPAEEISSPTLPYSPHQQHQQNAAGTSFSGGTPASVARQSGAGYDAMGIPITTSGAMIEPFPDKDGKPIPLAPQESIAIEPFPDQRGRPIPLKKATTAIEPMPDQSGNPIPLAVSDAR